MLSPDSGPYCSSHTNRSWPGRYCTTWSQQNLMFGAGRGNAVSGSIYWNVAPPSADTAAYQLPVYRTTLPLMAQLGSPTLEAVLFDAGPVSSLLTTRLTSSAAARAPNSAGAIR